MNDRAARLAQRHRAIVLGLAGAWFAVAVALISSGLGRLTTRATYGLEADRAEKLLDAVTGRERDTTFVALFSSSTLEPRSPPFREAMLEALAPLARDSRVASVVTPFDAPSVLADMMFGEHGHAAYALVSVKGDFSQAAHAYAALRGELRSDVLSVTCTGQLAFMHDLDGLLERDLIRAEAVSLPACVLLLAMVFGTVVAALLPVCVGALAVTSGIAAVVVLSRFVEMAQYTLNVCSLIGLGVAIDYSLFIVSRYREELAAGLDYEAALDRALATAGRVVLFSGFAVTVGLSGLLFFSRSYLMAVGLGGGIVVAFAVLFALTVLPALLSVLGPRIHWGRLPFTLPSHGAVWHRTALWVMRHPWATLLPALAVLLVMGSPFVRLQMAASDVRVLPLTTEARMGHELLRSEFPDAADTHVLVAVDFPTAPALNADRIDALYGFAERLAALPSVTAVKSIVDPSRPVPRASWAPLLLSPPPALAHIVEEGKRLSVGDRTVIIDVSTDEAPESAAARAIVAAIRSDRRVGDGSLLVGGATAADVDATQYIVARAPLVIGFVVAVTYVVLFLLLRSVLLPAKAVLMNILSIAGSFGALVWVFQEGHLFGHTPRPLDPTLPVLLFCNLFGLSMDYEVLMLTRMKETFDRTADNQSAVATGLEKSAGLITSTAAIMVAVFGSFALAHVVLIQATGFGMAVAVAMDATIVRVLVVPATMRLLGDWNWWAPGSPIGRSRA